MGRLHSWAGFSHHAYGAWKWRLGLESGTYSDDSSGTDPGYESNTPIGTIGGLSSNGNRAIAPYLLLVANQMLTDAEEQAIIADPDSLFDITVSNTPPVNGSAIPSLNIVAGVAGTLDISGHFSDTDAQAFAASPAGTAWPSWLTITSAGLVQWTTAAAAGTTSGLKVRDTDTLPQSTDSNAFSAIVTAQVSMLHSRRITASMQ